MDHAAAGDVLLQRWAQWARRGRYATGYGRSMTDIVISGIKGTVCRECRGDKFVDGEECKTCKGLGKVLMRGRGVNPALIPSTAPVYGDGTAERIDHVVCAMPRRRKRVVFEAYFGMGRQKDMAVRIKMSERTFVRELRIAREEVARAIEPRRRA